jgi:cytochrome c oxidase subunit 2
MSGLALVAALALAALALAALAAPPAPAVAPSTATPVPAAVLGKQLFVAKGCATCHRHGAVAAGAVHPNAYPFSGIPDLTAYRNDPAFLHAWLANPRAVRPTAEMPDLALTPAEIEALIAFLNDPAATR